MTVISTHQRKTRERKRIRGGLLYPAGIQSRLDGGVAHQRQTRSTGATAKTLIPWFYEIRVCLHTRAGQFGFALAAYSLDVLGEPCSFYG